MQIALVGTGQMGTAVERIATGRGHSVTARFNSEHPLTEHADASALNGADVVVDFSLPDVALAHVRRYADWGATAVVGTTGWYDALDEVRAAVDAGSGALLYAPNFSLGMALLVRAVAAVLPLVDRLPEYDLALHETHHVRKVDAPSGTAEMLADLVLRHLDRKTHVEAGRPDGRIDPSALHVTAARLGGVFGEHALTLDAPYDTIRLAHAAKNRDGFAFGAVRSAEWLLGRRGVYTLDDVLDAGL